MVARGKNNILHARLARESCDSSRVKILRCECLFQLVVLIERDFFQALDPLTFTQLGVESPVDEHPVGQGFEVSNAWKWRRDRHGFTWSPNLEVDSQGNGVLARLSFLKYKEEVANGVNITTNGLAIV